jgi:DNA-binding NarL/FixJ family response regulator
MAQHRPVTGKRTATNVVLFEEPSLDRAALLALLEHELGCRVVGGEDIEPAAVLRDTLRPAPSLAVVALRDRRRALALIGALAARPGLPCLRVDALGGASHVKAAFDAGALGYLLREDAPADLGHAVRAVAAGQRYLGPMASAALVDHLQRGEPVLPHHALTPRQLEVLRRVARGHATKTIAHDLGLSSRTVDAHRYQIHRRLEVRDVAGIVRYAIRHALVDEA